MTSQELYKMAEDYKKEYSRALDTSWIEATLYWKIAKIVEGIAREREIEERIQFEQDYADNEPQRMRTDLL